MDILIGIMFIYGTMGMLWPKLVIELNPLKITMGKAYKEIKGDEKFIKDTRIRGQITVVAALILLLLRFMGRI